MATPEEIAKQLMMGPHQAPADMVDPKDPFGLGLKPQPLPLPSAPPSRSVPSYQQSPEFQNWLGKRNNGDWHQRIIAPPG